MPCFITGGGHFLAAFLMAWAHSIDQAIMLLILYRITYRRLGVDPPHALLWPCRWVAAVGPAGTHWAVYPVMI